MKVIPAFTACVLFLSSWLVVFMPAEAASLYIDPGISTLNRGDSVTMSVRIDVDENQEECVNAVDAVIKYSKNIEPVDISIGDSIFTIWLEQPTIDRDERTITFAGGVPNGYCGRVIGDPRLTNTLTKIVFRSPGFTIGGTGTDEDVAIIDYTEQTQALLNDGKGTKAPLTTYGAKIELNSKPSATLQNDWQEQVSADQTPPEEFAIEIVKGDRNFSNKYYIVFNTTDKQTGIDHYEVMEEPLSQFGSFQWGRADAPWIIPEQQNVHVLEDQTLNSTIRVKAVDKAGNEYIATIIPDESMRTTLPAQKTINILFWLATLTLAAVVLGVFWFVWKRKKTADNDDDHMSEAEDTNNTKEEGEFTEEEDNNYENEQSN